MAVTTSIGKPVKTVPRLGSNKLKGPTAGEVGRGQATRGLKCKKESLLHSKCKEKSEGGCKQRQRS